MAYFLLTFLALSNLAWFYAILALTYPSSVGWLVSLVGTEGATPETYIGPALVIAVAFQSTLAAFILWENTKKKSLASKLRKTKEEKKNLTSASKEIEKKVAEQAKELEKANGVDERASLLATQVKDLETLNKELKSESSGLEIDNNRLQEKVHQLELKQAKKGSSLMDQLKAKFSKKK